MTAPALVRLLFRRWYIVVAVLALVGALFVTLERAGGAYVSEAKVVFVMPGGAAVGVFDDRKRDTLVEFVAAIEVEVNDGKQPDRLPEAAPLFGAGFSEGSQVVMPNTGGQWQYSFPDPVLLVRVTGPTPEGVRATLGTLLDRIDTLTADRQSGMDTRDVIGTERVPDDATVDYVGGSRRTLARALLALGLVGFGVAAVAAVLVDRLAGRLSTRRRQVRPSGQDLSFSPAGPSGRTLPLTTTPGADAHQTERVT